MIMYHLPLIFHHHQTAYYLPGVVAVVQMSEKKLENYQNIVQKPNK